MTVFLISKDGATQQVEYDGTAADLVAAAVLDEDEQIVTPAGPYAGWTVEDEAEGELGPYDRIEDGETVLDVARIDEDLHREIDDGFAAFCLLFVTPGPAMPMIYRDKGEQAKAVLADSDPDPADYPMIAREAAVRGMALVECALWIEAIAEDWSGIRDLIEPARQAAKLAVSAAATEGEKRAAAAVDYWAVLAAGQVAGI